MMRMVFTKISSLFCIMSYYLKYMRGIIWNVMKVFSVIWLIVITLGSVNIS